MVIAKDEDRVSISYVRLGILLSLYCQIFYVCIMSHTHTLHIAQTYYVAALYSLLNII